MDIEKISPRAWQIRMYKERRDVSKATEKKALFFKIAKIERKSSHNRKQISQIIPWPWAILRILKTKNKQRLAVVIQDQDQSKHILIEPKYSRSWVLRRQADKTGKMCHQRVPFGID
jgi:hypothetical protein